jgi:hypothetical protein
MQINLRKKLLSWPREAAGAHFGDRRQANSRLSQSDVEQRSRNNRGNFVRLLENNLKSILTGTWPQPPNLRLEILKTRL